MKVSHRLLFFSPMVVLVACTTPAPTLLFADNVTFGLQLGTNTASGGGGVTLGYKNRSVAIVPLSVLNDRGEAGALRAAGNDGKDALSVFAVFDASDPDRSGLLRVGQLFSTGVAAQALTEGYACQRAPESCKPPPIPRDVEAVDAATSAAIASAAIAASAASTASGAAATALASAAAASAAAASAKASVSSSNKEPKPDTSDGPYQWPLIYARTDVIGFDISGSAAERGASFTLGYTGRNLALIPAYARSTENRVTGLFGVGTGVQDAYSVLGQFDGTTSTSGLNFGIARYFATGMAAQHLARGIGAATAAKKPAPKASAAAAASSPPN